MITNFIIADSGMYKVINHLKKFTRGTILTVEDFKEIKGLSYTHIRTLFVTLCTKNVLIRVCRGVYCYPKIEGGKPIFPPIISVLSKLSKRDNYEICPAGEYAEYLMGIRETIPNNIICYNNDKIKTINFENGVSLKIFPSKRCFPAYIKNQELRMLVNYINNIGITNIRKCDKEKLIEYYNNLDRDGKQEAQKISSEIIDFLGIK